MVIADWPKWTENNKMAQEDNKSCSSLHLCLWLGKNLINCNHVACVFYVSMCFVFDCSQLEN